MQRTRKQSNLSDNCLLSVSAAKKCCLKLVNRELAPTAIKFALIVGSFISITNYGAALLTGKMTRGDWIALGVTYLIPYTVSIYGQSQSRPKNSYLDQGILDQGI